VTYSCGGARRLREVDEETGRDPASIAIHGRTYLAPGWQRGVEEAVEAGCSHFSFGFNRMMNRGVPHADQLAAVLDAKPELDTIVGNR
jgi:8-oxo-dGTP pyrophosphatase MutT (NUDIX family)